MFQRIRVFQLTSIAAAIGVLVACGGGSSSSSSPLPTPTPDANVAGSYLLTITASAVCAAQLPEDARVTQYTASLAQSGSSFTFNAVGKVGSMAVNGSTGTVSGNDLSLVVSIAEKRDRPMYVYQIAATGTARVEGSAIAGTANGLIQFVGPHMELGQCSATDHRLQFARQ